MQHRPTVIEINSANLKNNFSKITKHVSPAQVLASLKANAYGHGIVQCGRALQAVGCKWYGVAFVEEALLLRSADVSGRILVLGGLYAGQIDEYFEHDLDFTASSVFKLKQIEDHVKRHNKKARVHLKIDTGMERVGVHYYSANDLLEYARNSKLLDVVGIYSHFAKADPNNSEFSAVQLERFNQVCNLWVQKAKTKPLFHISSSGSLNLKSANLDLVRPGIAIFGGVMFPNEELQLEPVLTLKSEVIYFKLVKKGSGVSYGHTWIAEEDTRIVTIPIGYGDGYMRALSNKADVLIRGKRYPIVGSICMDQLMVNIGPTGEAYVGDEVVLIGKQGQEEITAKELAMKAGTINYEILTNLNNRIPRVLC